MVGLLGGATGLPGGLAGLRGDGDFVRPLLGELTGNTSGSGVTIGGVNLIFVDWGVFFRDGIAFFTLFNALFPLDNAL